MWDKVKSVLSQVSAILVAILSAVAYYFLSKDRKAEEALAIALTNQKMKDSQERVKETQHAAQSKVDDFERLATAYERGQSGRDPGAK